MLPASTARRLCMIFGNAPEIHLAYLQMTGNSDVLGTSCHHVPCSSGPKALGSRKLLATIYLDISE